MHENYVRCKLGSLNGKNYYLCKKNCSCSIVTTNKQIRKCIGKLVKIYVFFIQKKKYEKFGKCYLRSFESFYAVTNKSIFEINYTKI